MFRTFAITMAAIGLVGAVGATAEATVGTAPNVAVRGVDQHVLYQAERTIGTIIAIFDTEQECQDVRSRGQYPGPSACVQDRVGKWGLVVYS